MQVIQKPKVCVIGLGEIGGSVFGELLNHLDKFDLVGVDIDEAKFDPMLGGVQYATEPPEADVYLICVWSMDQILATLDKVADHVRRTGGLVSIESTIEMSRFDELLRFITVHGLASSVVTMPHRWNPGDPEHGVFNQRRVLGTIFSEAGVRALHFYGKVMPPSFIHHADFMVAALCKVAENAHRAMEIILAQELSRSCEQHGFNFRELRDAMNTKWNIDVMEARDGVKGKCLPKDLDFFCRMFPEHVVARVMRAMNEEYKKTDFNLKS